MSLNTVDTVNAGDLFPVDVVLQNVGYNNLSDMYVIASIPALGISKTAFFGDSRKQVAMYTCNRKNFPSDAL